MLIQSQGVIDELDRRIENFKKAIDELTKVRNAESAAFRKSIAQLAIDQNRECLAQLQDFRVWLLLCIHAEPGIVRA